MPILQEVGAENIRRTIQAFYDEGKEEHHRNRSWNHCYNYFRQSRPKGLAADRDLAALQLAFYLASWGMYRGSSFLLQHAYTVHRGVIDLISEARFDTLWAADFGAGEKDGQLVPRIRDLIDDIRQAYKPFVREKGSAQPTDTLITKVILGTFGCLPACDEYFIKGFKSEGYKYSMLNANYLMRILGFCRDHVSELLKEQASIKQSSGLHYPIMKLVDMYFWQLGREGNSAPSYD
ncbi:MAG: hypothetical protein PHI34_03505 [Acidobacteriota bacterium]|nr:hypothetical protein [Acidobacteriota bacterium]